MVENLNVTAHETMTLIISIFSKTPSNKLLSQSKIPKGIHVFTKPAKKKRPHMTFHLTNRDREQLIKAKPTESTTQTL